MIVGDELWLDAEHHIKKVGKDFVLVVETGPEPRVYEIVSIREELGKVFNYLKSVAETINEKENESRA